MKRPLAMRIELSALEHLGMNLYSNTPAVVSEVVANAWDADAELVQVRYDRDSGSIAVFDDGRGMTRDEVIDRFLVVGYRRRDQNSKNTPKHGRQPMGRKGIGKLSCFSIADIVTVYTSRSGERTAFRMDADEIKKQIKQKNDRDYEPEELEDDWYEDLESDGTCVVLTGLKKNITKLSSDALKQRVARRFSILGAQFNFQVELDGVLIEAQDRGYLDKVQYLWTYGNQPDIRTTFTGLDDGVHPESRTAAVQTFLNSVDAGNLSVTGWIGTVKTPNQLKDEDGQNLNRLAIFMRGKMAQEDILGEMAEKRIVAGYMVGELHCDLLDDDDDDDIATSSRQAIKADDERYEALRDAVRKEISHIAPKWNELRITRGAEIVAGEVPEVLEWLGALEGDTKHKAERWIGRLNVIRVSTGSDRRELLKSSVLAFESYRRKEMLDSLDSVEDDGLEHVLGLFKDIDDLQLSYYGQIVKMRVKVIDTLSAKLKEDEYEKAIQEHIYEHLWLIDPSWERVHGTAVIESSLGDFLKKNTDGLTEAEKLARIDIGYRAAAGRHVIIEMKRGSVTVQIDDLTKQIRKYHGGAKKLLEQADENDWPLEIVCLVGKPPSEWNERNGKHQVQEALKLLDARLVFYDQLLKNTQDAYEDYLETHNEVDKLAKIFNAIDDFDAAEATADS